MFNNINSFIYNARKMHLAFSLQVYKPQYIKVDFKKNLDVKEQLNWQKCYFRKQNEHLLIYMYSRICQVSPQVVLR